jgi:hypothetical protein
MARAEEPSRGWRDRLPFVLLSTAAVAAIALSLGSIVVTFGTLERLAPGGRSELEAAERRVTAFGSRLAQLKRREQLGEWIQQEIQRANPRLDVAAARDHGRLLLEITEKFNSVDPLFLWRLASSKVATAGPRAMWTRKALSDPARHRPLARRRARWKLSGAL